MTPKEKAKELVQKFANVEDTEWQIDNGCGITYNEGIQCALIAVGEILELLPELAFGNRYYKYFIEVKQEIEKL